MSFRVLFKLHPSRDRFVYIAGRYDPLFDHTMREDRNRLAMEEVEYPVVPTLEPHPKFINAVPEVIRFRPAEFVSQISEALDPDATLVQHLGWKSVQPIKHWNCVGIFLVEDDPNLRQSVRLVCSQN
jgi:hypothetical protein